MYSDEPGLSFIQSLVRDCHDLLQDVTDVLPSMLLIHCSTDQHPTSTTTGILHAIATADHMLRRRAGHPQRLQTVRPRVLHYR